MNKKYLAKLQGKDDTISVTASNHLEAATKAAPKDHKGFVATISINDFSIQTVKKINKQEWGNRQNG